MLTGRSSNPLTRRDDDRRITRLVVVSVATHLGQAMRKQIVSWAIVSGLLASGLVFNLIWWSFIATAAYLVWLSRSSPHRAALPQTAMGALDDKGDLDLPSVRWLDVMPDEADFRQAIASLLPDRGASFSQAFAPHSQAAATVATRQIQRALHQQRALVADASALIAYASDFLFPVAMIPLRDAGIRLDTLPAAPIRAVVESEDGPWLLVALGQERPAVVRAAAAAPPAARPAAPPPVAQPASRAATGTTELELRAVAPAQLAEATAPAASFEDMFAAMLQHAPRRQIASDVEQRILAEARAAGAGGPLEWSQAAAPAGSGRAVEDAAARPLDRARRASMDIPLGYNRDTGELITIPIAALSGILVVAFGIPRTGKTSSLEGLVQRTSQAGMPWGVAYDTKPEWYGLRCAVELSEAVPLIVLGDGARADVQMPHHGLSQALLDLPQGKEERRERMELLAQTLTSWQRTVEWLMEHRQSWICDLSSERIGIEGSNRVLTAVFLAAVRSARRHRQPFGILIDEAQNALPQGRMRKALWEAAMGITRTAPSLGVTTFLAAHRPTDVDKDLIAPARLRILHRVDLPLDIEAYSRMLPWSSDQVARTVESLRPGEAIVYGPNLLSSGNAPVVVRMMPATTFHVGYTPAIGVQAPTEPPRLPIDPAVLDAIAHIPGASIPRRSTPAAAPAPLAPDAPSGEVAAGDFTPGPDTSGRLDLLTPERWPQDVQASVEVMLRNPAVRNLILRADRVGVSFPVLEQATGATLARKARQAVLEQPGLVALLGAARAAGVEHKPLARLMFAIGDPGRAAIEIGEYISAWEARQQDETGPQISPGEDRNRDDD